MSDDPRHEHFQALFKRVQQGSHEAARELYDTYLPHVIRGVRVRLWRKMRTRFDSQDFAQQVFASFFDAPENLPDFDSPEALSNYLVGMAFKKVTGEGRHLLTQKQDIQREQEIDAQSAADRPHPFSRDPTPSAVAVYHEQYDRLVDRQPPHVQRVVKLRLTGKTFEEIAAELEIDESTARRVIKRLQSQTQEAECPPDEAAPGVTANERGARS